MLASALRPLDGFFQLPLLALPLAIVGLFSDHHERFHRLLLRLRLDWPIPRPQVAIDLTNRRVLQPKRSRSRGLLRLDVFYHPRKHLSAQMPEVVAHNRLARCDFNHFAVPNTKHAAADGDIALDVALVAPSHDADRKRGQQVRVARFDPERAAGVLGANVARRLSIDRDLGGRDNHQLHWRRPTATPCASRLPSGARPRNSRPCKTSFPPIRRLRPTISHRSPRSYLG